jgi:hypothetical protein
MPVRRSPNYFHVSESGPSGWAGPPVARRGEVVAVLALVIELAVMASSLSVSTHGCAVTIVLDNTRCPRSAGAWDAEVMRWALSRDTAVIRRFGAT